MSVRAQWPPSQTTHHQHPATKHISHLQISLTAEQKALYPELAKLQDDINRLKENELQLRNQIFYTGSQADLSNAGAAQIGYSY